MRNYGNIVPFVVHGVFEIIFSKGLDFSLWLQYNLIVVTKKRGDYMGIHKGMKLTDIPKDRTLRVRIDAETAKKLDEVCQRQQQSKSEVVRVGINIQYDAIKEK